MRKKLYLLLMSLFASGVFISGSAVAIGTPEDPMALQSETQPQHEDPAPPRWSDWSSIGGVATSDPASCSLSGFRTVVFVRGTDNSLWFRYWDGYTWSAWASLGGVLTSAPAATCRTSNRIDVFARGADNALWHLWFAGGWSTWESLGGGLSSGPGTNSSAKNHVMVFVRGADNAIWYRSYR